MKVTPSPALMNSSLAASLCLLAGAMSVNAASIALDQMAYNPPWGRTSLDSVNAYTAISGDGGSANQVYAASAAGGIVAWGFNKTWSPGTWGSTNVVGSGSFTALTRDASRPNIVFGALSTGGIVQYEFNGSTWNANVVDNSSRVYTSLTYDSTNQNKIYGASSAGLYEVAYGAGWGANLLTTTAYTQVTANGTGEGLKLYGLTGAGSVYQVSYSGTWQTASISGSETYTTIVGDGLDSNKVYAALATGGINQLEYNGLFWSTNNIAASGEYTALANRDQTSNNIYGSTITGDFNEISYGGAWNTNTLFTGQNYDQLVSDGARDPAIFGIAVPEPSGIALLGLGAAFLLMGCRRR